MAKTRPDAPPPGEWLVLADKQELEGSWRRLRGKASLEGSDLLFRADEMDYNEETGDVEARGNIYFKEFEENQEIWADRVVYNVEEERGKFYNIRGKAHTRIDPRPGILHTTNPFYFEGEWAEREGGTYTLFNGFITNCNMPHPWWRLRGPRFVIVPGDHATAYRSMFLVRRFPLFYTPFFYKSLEQMPRRSGFLMPNIGNSSRRGKMVGVAYYWAINRSYDTTYRIQDFTARGLAHTVDFRGKPREGSDFDAVFYGVQDRGLEKNGQTYKAGGASLSLGGKSDLGRGFTARGQLNYLSTLRFRQDFTDSFTEAVFSEVHSVGFVNRNWSSYVFNAVFSRLEEFQRSELEIADPVTGEKSLLADSVILRKMPEVTLSSRDRELVRGPLPVWVSFEGGAGLLYRSQPVFENDRLIDRYETATTMNRLDFQPRLTTALRWREWNLIPSFAVRTTRYGETQAPYQNHFRVIGQNLTRRTTDFSVDLIAPSLARTFERKTWLGEKVRHVIEPRLSFRNTTGVDDFNATIRFDQLDVLSNTRYGQISVVNRLFAKNGGVVSEVFSWELAQRRYFDSTFGGAVTSGRRNVVASAVELTPYAFLNGPRSTSPVVSVFRASPKPGFGVDWRADYDPSTRGVTNSSFNANMRISRFSISAGHSQVHSDPVLSPSANQFQGTLSWANQNGRGWNAAFQAVYDYRQGVMQYAVTQVTYNTDCCGFSVQYRRLGFRNENQFVASFAVANIGSFGTLKKQERLQ